MKNEEFRISGSFFIKLVIHQPPQFWAIFLLGKYKKNSTHFFYVFKLNHQRCTSFMGTSVFALNCAFLHLYDSCFLESWILSELIIHKTPHNHFSPYRRFILIVWPKYYTIMLVLEDVPMAQIHTAWKLFFQFYHCIAFTIPNKSYKSINVGTTKDFISPYPFNNSTAIKAGVLHHLLSSVTVVVTSPLLQVAPTVSESRFQLIYVLFIHHDRS